MTFDEALARVPGFIGGGDNIISARLADLPGVAQTAEQLRARKMRLYEEILATLTVATRPGFREVFDWFAAQGLPVAIGSLTVATQAGVLLRRSGITELIPADRTVLREHVTRVKPAPDVFLETARRMGIDPADQLVFEDSPRGVQAGVAAGSRVIAMPVYTMAKAQRDLIDAGAVRIFWDWREMDIEALITNLNQG